MTYSNPLDLFIYAGIKFKARCQETLNFKFGIHDQTGKNIVTWETPFTVPGTPF